MKSAFKKILLSIAALLTLAACEDVPAPYYLLERIIDSSVILDEPFANSLGKFSIYNETSDGYEWANQYNTAYISGFQNSVNKETKTWLISPAFDLSSVEQAYVTFEYVLRYKRSTTKEVLRVSPDYIGSGDPTQYTWYELDIPLPETADYKNFLTAGAQLPDAVIGQKKVYIALYYEAPESEASTWEVKNLLVREGEYDDPNKEEPEEGVYIYEKFASSFGVFTPTIVNEDGYNWSINYSSAYISGYQNKVNKATEAYLVSEPVDLTASERAFLSFQYVYMYKRESCRERILVAKDYTGDPTTTQWQDLNIELEVTPDYNTFYEVGINLPEELIGEGNSSLVFALYYYATEKEASTWEVRHFRVQEGEYKDNNDDPIPGVNGSGTAEDPYDVASAIQIIKEGKSPSKAVYIHGIITSLGDANGADKPGNTYGNATYFISDVDESGAPIGEALEIFRGLGLGGERITTSDYLKEGDDVIVCGVLTYFQNKTPEVAQNSTIYSLNGISPGNVDYGKPSGAGTQDDPYNVAATIDLIDKIGTKESDYIYTRGVISSIEEISANYGNATYKIIDPEYNYPLVVFRGKGLAGADIKSDDIHVGDEVVIYGKVSYYGNHTREFLQGNQIYMINGKKAEVSEPTGSGTLEDPYNAAAANEVASKLGNGQTSGIVYIKGKVASIKEQYGTQYGNGTFYISDDGTTKSQFYVFQALYLGNQKYTSGTLLKQGDDVIICGKLTMYNSTPETQKGEAYLYSLNGDTGNQNPTLQPGTYANPWTVNEALESYVDGQKISTYVSGWVVGYVSGQKIDSAVFGEGYGLTKAPQNLLIADSPREDDYTRCLVVKLPKGTLLDRLNIMDNPGIYGMRIKLYGSVEKYFSVAGLQSLTFAEYTVNGQTITLGNRPDEAKKR